MANIVRTSSMALTLALPLPAPAQLNIIVFVTDGLRAAAASPERAATFAKVRDTGVDTGEGNLLRNLSGIQSIAMP
jgi:hypothetical protein